MTLLISRSDSGQYALMLDQKHLSDFLAKTESRVLDALADFGIGFLLLILGWLIAKRAEKLLRGFLQNRAGLDATLAFFLGSVIRYGILVVVLAMALAKMGVQTTSLLAVLGAAGLAIGLALQGTLSNIAAGVMLIILRPLKVGECVRVGDQEGHVVVLKLFATELRRTDGVYISIPNAQIWGREIINFDRNPNRRLSVPVSISYRADLNAVREIILNAAASTPGVLAAPPADILVKDFADNAINLDVRVWCMAGDYGVLRSTLRLVIKQALDEAGVDIPLPQRVVHVVGNETSVPDEALGGA